MSLALHAEYHTCVYVRGLHNGTADGGHIALHLIESGTNRLLSSIDFDIDLQLL